MYKKRKSITAGCEGMIRFNNVANLKKKDQMIKNVWKGSGSV